MIHKKEKQTKLWICHYFIQFNIGRSIPRCRIKFLYDRRSKSHFSRVSLIAAENYHVQMYMLRQFKLTKLRQFKLENYDCPKCEFSGWPQEQARTTVMSPLRDEKSGRSHENSRLCVSV